jgi:hypothetical protein
LSTAHTLFHYDRFGPGVFRDLISIPIPLHEGARPARWRSRYSIEQLARAEEREADLWHELLQVRRHISRQAYEKLAARLPLLRPLR